MTNHFRYSFAESTGEKFLQEAKKRIAKEESGECRILQEM